MELINTCILGLFTFLLLAFYNYIFLRSKPHNKNQQPPPLAGGAWPVIGHLHLLGGPQAPHITLANLADKYGPIFTVKLGHYKAIIVSRWDIAKECFTTHDLQILTRPDSLVADLMSYDFAMFGFSPYGPYWREIRKLIAVELLSPRRLELLKTNRVSEVEMSSKELYEFWRSRKSKSSPDHKVVVDMKEWLGNHSLNTVLRMIAGQRYFVSIADHGDKEREEATRVQRVLREFLHFVGLFLPADSFPILKHFDFGGLQKKMKAISAEVDNLVGEWLKEHRQNRKSRQVSADHDFIDVMISMLEEAQIDADYDPDTIIKSTCINLIAGGSDSTTVTLTWAVARVMKNPQILEKVKAEVDFHVGKDRRVTDADIPKLVYLQAVVKETLRLYPAGPLGGPRELAQDANIGGYHVPKGTRVIVNLWKMHRDPDVWVDDPTEFKPERFLTTHKDFDVKGRNFELIPFSAGRRNCPGANLALQMVHLILGNLFHAFDLEIPNGRKIDLKESAGVTNHLVGPLELVLVPRLPANLY
ncbi:OLC1v1024961C1 [Oldenlandia corymbosa var. corymbosa]|uniref:OLC1v1024961C1 n=1 Tax=Oldenlandia corymbosa var. corymbosa TaxID=529605 RepID=A0AAV1C5B3_OLDCO|nr:OLC1v1024961C1 [Oldenlandia corymbosa var. corymbosa]